MRRILVLRCPRCVSFSLACRRNQPGSCFGRLTAPFPSPHLKPLPSLPLNRLGRAAAKAPPLAIPRPPWIIFLIVRVLSNRPSHGQPPPRGTGDSHGPLFRLLGIRLCVRWASSTLRLLPDLLLPCQFSITQTRPNLLRPCSVCSIPTHLWVPAHQPFSPRYNTLIGRKRFLRSCDTRKPTGRVSNAPNRSMISPFDTSSSRTSLGPDDSLLHVPPHKRPPLSKVRAFADKGLLYADDGGILLLVRRLLPPPLLALTSAPS